jgi:predicted CXXCH cytochrome family protein
MRQVLLIIIFLTIISFGLNISASSEAAMPKCKVCHSKNPKMVAMHKALEYKDCFKCHGPGGLWPPNLRAEQMQKDARCTGCHLRPEEQK